MNKRKKHCSPCSECPYFKRHFERCSEITEWGYHTVIIKSFVKNEENWSGKEFSNNPAKLYASFNDAAGALDCYWFNEWVPEKDVRPIKIIHLQECQKNKLLGEGKVRW